MAKYVYLATFYSNTGKFDEVRDTARMNEILHKLQQKNTKIISVEPSLGNAGDGVAAVFVITYEAEEPVEF